jgi:hypothetical protein
MGGADRIGGAEAHGGVHIAHERLWAENGASGATCQAKVGPPQAMACWRWLRSGLTGAQQPQPVSRSPDKHHSDHHRLLRPAQASHSIRDMTTMLQ